MNYVRWFQDIDGNEIELVGGKAANLGEMASANFPVPPGFCVTAPAYRAVIETTGLLPAIQKVLARTDLGNQTEVVKNLSHVREIIRQHPMPTSLAEEIRACYYQLGQELGLEDLSQLPVAIRSSATAEDLPSASFAGQQDTYLNIRGEEALLDHIRLCWASLWTDRAVIYRTNHGFDHLKVYVSVVVQAMVASEVSGVLFTVNPVSGSQDEVVINASWGLGEAIVSGLVSPDTITMQKEDGRILLRQTAAKKVQMIYSDGGGIVEIETPEHQQRAPALSDRQAEELANLGLQIEGHYGAPQDIEWAIADEKLYVLQARPITTLEPIEQVLDANGQHRSGEYSRIMLVEIIPEALSPLYLSVIIPLMQSMFEFTFNTLGFRPPQDMDAVAGFYNQPYFHKEYIEKTLSPLSPGIRRPMVEKFINPISHEEQSSRWEWSWAYAGMIVRMLRFIQRFPKLLPRILDRYHAEVQTMRAVPLKDASDKEIVTHILSLVFDTVSQLLNYDFLIIALTGRCYDILEALLMPHFGERSEEVVAKLNSGLEGNLTMETNMALWDLALEAQKSKAVCDTLESVDPAEVGTHLAQRPEAQGFLKRVDHFLSVYGHREIRFDILYPTWREDPRPVYGFLRSYLTADKEQSPYQQQERLVKERLELTAEVLSLLSRNLTDRLILKPLFSWLLAHTQILTCERDTMHFEWTRIYPPARRFFKELGDRWQARGLIGRQDDIYFMRFNELQEMASSPKVWDLSAERRDQLKAANSRTLPEIVRDGKAIYLKKALPAGAGGGGIQGVAGSPGQVTGVPRVIRGPEEFHKLKQGEILVAPLTNPVWTPLFAVASGLVTEVGGILSHGAIVAREYGIPAVMSVPNATEAIDGQEVITVDGDRGIVYLKGEGPK